MFVIDTARADGSMIQHRRDTIATALRVAQESIGHGALTVMITDHDSDPVQLVYVWIPSEPNPTEDFIDGMEDFRMHTAEGWPLAETYPEHWDSLSPMYQYGYRYSREIRTT